MLQLLSIAMKTPSFVSAMSSSSVPVRGSMETFTMRMSGGRFHPSARIVPVERLPKAAAVSRLDR